MAEAIAVAPARASGGARDAAPLHALFSGLRAQADVLRAAPEGPHAELLAMVWGARFDREHARGLLASWPHALQSALAAADSFDALDAARQRRLRQAIVRDRARRAGA